MVVAGPAGIGKTVLVDTFLSDTTAPVLAGVCDDLNVPQVLGPFEDIALAHPELEEAFDQGLATFRRRLFDRLTSHPVDIVLIEDIHWADGGSLDLLQHLGRRIAQLRTLLIVTVRTDIGPDHSTARFLARLPTDRMERIDLTELSPASVASLCAGTDADPDAVYRLSGGNPFLATQLIESDNPVPAPVASSVSARLLSLGPSATSVARQLSVYRGTIGWDVIEGDPNVPAVDLADLEVAGLIESLPAGVRFRHELIRRTVEADLATIERRAANRTAMERLLALSASPSRIAHHAAEAADEAGIATYSREAMDEALRAGAHREAREHVLAVLFHSRALSPPDRAELLRLAAQTHWWTNRPSEALETARQAIAAYESLEDHRRLGATLNEAATYAASVVSEEACAEYRDRAIEVLESVPPSDDLAIVYIAKAQDLVIASRLRESVPWTERALALDPEILGDATSGRAMAARASVMTTLGSIAQGRDDGETALELLERSSDHAGRAIALTNRVASSINALDLENVDQHIAAAKAFLDEVQLPRAEVALDLQVARLAVLRGDWQAAEEVAQLSLETAATGLKAATAVLVLALLDSRRGDRTGAETRLAQALDLLSPTRDIQRLRGAAEVMAELTWLGPTSYKPEIERVYDIARESGFVRAEAELAIWLRRLRGQAVDIDSPEPFALEAAGDHQGAAAAWDRLGAPYQRALALAFSGDFQLMRESVEVMDDLGAVASRDRVRQMMRELGFRFRRSRNAATRSNPALLTARQLEVLSLVADNLSNRDIATRLFISPKTVDHHVSAIISKLGAKDRHEAARRFADLPESPG